MALVAGLWRRAKPLLRLKPFDVSTEHGRAEERHRRVALTSLAAVFAKTVSIATALISVPLTLHYLGVERYGMWMTISSLVAMLSFADFGIGNGILNSVATAYGKDNVIAIRQATSSGLFVLICIAILVLAVFAAVFPFVTWAAIFNVHSPRAVQEAGPAIAALVVCFALTIPASVVQRVQMGQQKGFMANLWQCASSIMALLAIILAVKFKAGLPWLVVAFAGSPLIAALINAVVYFGWSQPEVAPSWRFVSRHKMKQVADLGVLFFLIQISSSVSYASDNIVLAQLLGATAVAQYSVPQRLFSVIGMFLGFALTPLWPAYGEAMARADAAWVKRTLKRSLVASAAISGVASLGLAAFGPTIIHLWVGTTIHTSVGLLIGLALWQVLLAGGMAVANFLNGTNEIWFQVKIGVVSAAFAIFLKIFLVLKIGISGVVWATIIAFTVFSVVPLYFFLSKKLSSVGEIKGETVRNETT